jgi:hypothetical protein
VKCGCGVRAAKAHKYFSSALSLTPRFSGVPQPKRSSNCFEQFPPSRAYFPVTYAIKSARSCGFNTVSNPSGISDLPDARRS